MNSRSNLRFFQDDHSSTPNKTLEYTQVIQPSFMGDNIRDIFDNARKDIRKRAEQEVQQTNSSFLVGNQRRRDTSNNSSLSYVPSKLPSAKGGATGPYTSVKDLLSFNKENSSLNMINSSSQSSSQNTLYQQKSTIKENREQIERQQKIDSLKNNLRSVLNTSSTHLIGQKQQVFTDSQHDSVRSSLSGISSARYNLQPQIRQAAENSKILISQLVSPKSIALFSQSATPNRLSSRGKSQEQYPNFMIGSTAQKRDMPIESSHFATLQSMNDKEHPRYNNNNQNRSKTPKRMIDHVFAGSIQSPRNQDYGTSSNYYYEKGPTSDVRRVLHANQDIEGMLSKEEIFKIQNALLEGSPAQIQKMPYSYVCELLRLSEIIQKVIGENREDYIPPLTELI